MSKYTNEQMMAMFDSLKPHLDRRDIIGYAAARNTRALRDELVEYSAIWDELVTKYGENDGAQVRLSLDSPSFKEFEQEILPFAKIEHEPKLFTIPFDAAIDKLSGNELLEIDWMFEESED